MGLRHVGEALESIGLLAQIEGRCVLQEFEAVALCPAAIGVAAAKGARHRFVELAAGDGRPPAQQEKQGLGSKAVGCAGGGEEIGHEGMLL
jgi:hypothetical protein|nr:MULTISPECIES: hypothetical protein [Sphingomonadaceae]